MYEVTPLAVSVDCIHLFNVIVLLELQRVD